MTAVARARSLPMWRAFSVANTVLTALFAGAMGLSTMLDAPAAGPRADRTPPVTVA